MDVLRLPQGAEEVVTRPGGAVVMPVLQDIPQQQVLGDRFGIAAPLAQPLREAGDLQARHGVEVFKSPLAQGVELAAIADEGHQGDGHDQRRGGNHFRQERTTPRRRRIAVRFAWHETQGEQQQGRGDGDESEAFQGAEGDAGLGVRERAKQAVGGQNPQAGANRVGGGDGEDESQTLLRVHDRPKGSGRLVKIVLRA